MSETTQPDAKRQATRYKRALRSPWMHLVIAFVALALVQGFLVKVYQVPSASMEPTLQTDGLNSDRMLVNRLAYLNGGPSVGDVIVFNADEEWQPPVEQSPLREVAGTVGDIVGFGPSNQHALVKRVLAGPGDTLEGAGGQLILNGQALDESYIGSNFEYQLGVLDCTTQPASLTCFPPITVPDDQYLVLGDNRANSADSLINCRLNTDVGDCAKFVNADDIVGEAIVILYPFNRWGQQLSTAVQAGETP